MKDYSYYNRNNNDRLLSDGEKIFDLQLSGIEGKDIVIKSNDASETATRGCVYNSINPDATSKEDRIVAVKINEKIQRGNYVEIQGENYPFLVLSDVDNHYAYKSCVVRKCNQVLQVDMDTSFGIVASDDSYGSKSSLNSDLLNSVDNKLKVEVQYNDTTRHIMPDYRFILNNSSTDIFKIMDRKTSVAPGLIVWICKKDTYMPEYDDLENNLAYNGTIEEPTPADYTLEGEDEIKINQVYQYKLFPSIGNPMWKLDDYTVMNNLAELSLVDAYTVEVKGLVQGEFIELICEVEGVIISKEIMIVR